MGDWGGYRGPDRRRVPRWFWLVAIALMLWGAMGIVSYIQQVRLGAEAMGPSTAYDRMFYGALPVWYNPLFAMTVGRVLPARWRCCCDRRWRGSSSSCRWSGSSRCSAGCSWRPT
ncbi:hypothetical protein [Sphingomonas sp. Leaf339]|uniref:hypothetical protein n=1 Tax=Sphingomonas sp. Leaf339 TaxID=1736343 RepID=UPI000B106881|nr:hypothetical protein [Sphingomonas sp. Leaf339]